MFYERLDYSLFESRFRDYNRLGEFPKGLRVLFNYLEEIAEEYEHGLELDVIALCSEFRESSIQEAVHDTGYRSIAELQDNATVLRVDDSTIIYSVC